MKIIAPFLFGLILSSNSFSLTLEKQLDLEGSKETYLDASFKKEDPLLELKAQPEFSSIKECNLKTKQESLACLRYKKNVSLVAKQTAEVIFVWSVLMGVLLLSLSMALTVKILGINRVPLKNRVYSKAQELLLLIKNTLGYLSYLKNKWIRLGLLLIQTKLLRH